MDYEKTYKEALKKAKRLYEQGTITESLAHIFPELKESEGEGIRKNIISFLRSKNGYMNPDEDWDFHNRWLPWLEKQGKQSDSDVKDYTNIDPHFGKPVDRLEPKFKTGDKLISTKNPHLTYEIFGIEDNELGELDYNVIIYTDGKDGVTHNISCKNVDAWGELVKEKPAWSEEDEEELGIAIEYLQQAGQWDSATWLKSLKTKLGGK